MCSNLYLRNLLRFLLLFSLQMLSCHHYLVQPSVEFLLHLLYYTWLEVLLYQRSLWHQLQFLLLFWLQLLR
jgi:hypothetical protein